MNGVDTLTGFYVSVLRGTRAGYLLGPCWDHGYVLGRVEDVRAAAAEVNDWAHFYAFGTCRITAATLPEGQFNDRLQLPESARAGLVIPGCVMCDAGIRAEHEHTASGLVTVASDFGDEP